VAPGSGLPTDNSRGFYRWPVGIQGGTCDRAYLAQTASNLTGASLTPGSTGAFLGGIPVARVIGGRFGPRLDASDQACATESLERAQTGQTISWQTAEGVPVTFQVTRTLEQGDSNCRDYVVTARFASQADTMRGKACKQTNGAWVAR
jgi:surface antigen